MCSSPPVYLVDDEADIEAGKAMVDWSPPVFFDNSLKEVRIKRKIWIGKDEIQPSDVFEDGSTTIAVFPIGTTSLVEYTAEDVYGNSAQCILNITLQGKT